MLGHANLAEPGAIRREHLHTITRAAPDAAINVDAKAIRKTRIDLGEDTAIGQTLAIDNIECTNVMIALRVMRDAAVGDVQRLFIRRKREATRR